MGTDVYLGWEGMTKEEKEAQYTGFDIGAGSTGYLRAAIGMVRENEALREIFPENIWEGKGKGFKIGGTKFIEFDFRGQYGAAMKAVLAYILGRINEFLGGHIVEVPEADSVVEQQQVVLNIVMSMMSAVNSKEGDVKVHLSDSLDIDAAIIWASSVVQFMRLGCVKQEEGRRVGVYISW